MNATEARAAATENAQPGLTQALSDFDRLLNQAVREGALSLVLGVNRTRLPFFIPALMVRGFDAVDISTNPGRALAHVQVSW